MKLAIFGTKLLSVKMSGETSRGNSNLYTQHMSDKEVDKSTRTVTRRIQNCLNVCLHARI